MNMSMDRSLLSPLRAPTELGDESSALSGNEVEVSSLQPCVSPAGTFLTQLREELKNLGDVDLFLIFLTNCLNSGNFKIKIAKSKLPNQFQIKIGEFRTIICKINK